MAKRKVSTSTNIWQELRNNPPAMSQEMLAEWHRLTIENEETYIVWERAARAYREFEKQLFGLYGTGVNLQVEEGEFIVVPRERHRFSPTYGSRIELTVQERETGK